MHKLFEIDKDPKKIEFIQGTPRSLLSLLDTKDVFIGSFMSVLVKK